MTKACDRGKVLLTWTCYFSMSRGEEKCSLVWIKSIGSVVLAHHLPWKHEMNMVAGHLKFIQVWGEKSHNMVNSCWSTLSQDWGLNTRELLLMEILTVRIMQDLTTNSTLTSHLGSAGDSEMVTTSAWQISQHGTPRESEKCCTGKLNAPLHRKDARKRKRSLFPILPPHPDGCCDTGTLEL